MIFAAADRNDGALTREWLERVGAVGIVQSAPNVWLAHDSHGDVHRAGNVTVVAEPAGRAAEIAQRYILWGGGVGPLAGPCAYVLYDATAGRLMASNDILSGAPIAYWSGGGRTVLCTGVLALLRHPLVPRALNDLYLAHVVTDYASAPPGTTAIAGIRRLTAGETITIEEGASRLTRTDRLCPRVPSGRSLADGIADFWDTLSLAIQRLSGPGACLALSGGIDSAVVGVALRRHVPALHALSLLAPHFSDAHEAAGIDIFEQTFPDVFVQRIDCSTATEFPELGEFVLRDDPPLAPVGLLPARLRLWHAARAAGKTEVFDGEGGDEVFSLFVSPLQALRAGDLPAVLGSLRGHLGSRRNLMWRSLVLPHLPSTLRKRWLAHWARDRRHVPSFLRYDAQSHPAIAEATDQRLAMFTHASLRSSIESWASAPNVVGASLAQRALASAADIRLVSPLLDRQVVELTLGLAPRWLLSDGVSKGFLREALRGHMTEAFRMRAKDTTMADALARRMLTSTGARERLRDRVVRRRLEPWVRFDRVEGILDSIAGGAATPTHVLWQMEALTSFADWYRRANQEYGVE